ncbi:hypothetical protein BDW74DRAFT_152730 [Aspergillus multicolor]|uniref:uncharacterized protein n=1 Tax=Aspergillus multicolor TaxID=41759 RepID=UPI003CCD9684
MSVSLTATRPTLQRVLSGSGSSLQHHRPLSIAIPARLAGKHNPRSQKPRGFLAEKGPFKFQQRVISYEELISPSRSGRTGATIEADHMGLELLMLGK